LVIFLPCPCFPHPGSLFIAGPITSVIVPSFFALRVAVSYFSPPLSHCTGVEIFGFLSPAYLGTVLFPARAPQRLPFIFLSATLCCLGFLSHSVFFPVIFVLQFSVAPFRGSPPGVCVYQLSKPPTSFTGASLGTFFRDFVLPRKYGCTLSAPCPPSVYYLDFPLFSQCVPNLRRLDTSKGVVCFVLLNTP